MARPDNITKYPEVDLKLGIKSSLPNVKATLSLLMMIWKASNSPSELDYSKATGNAIEIADDLGAALIERYRYFYSAEGVTDERFINVINNNQLFQSQLESLIVAFELVWRVAKITFEDNIALSSERTGGKRYPKTLRFTKNMDIIDVLLSSDDDQYSKVLLLWLGVMERADLVFETRLLKLLVHLSEEAIYKMSYNEQYIIFNMHGVYAKLAEGIGFVDLGETEEPKGAFRILKSTLSDGMNPYLSYSSDGGGRITAASAFADALPAYRQRVETYLSLTRTKEPDVTENIQDVTENIQDVEHGCNILLYGVPGSGKSFTINSEYCNDESRMERLVFHPDYTYSDFVGQILPKVSAEGSVTYEFAPGPFTRLLRRVRDNPGTKYFLIIEEINRGNAPAIFGDLFQLLDRLEDGTSEYSITNADIAKYVYENEDCKVRIPSNMIIVGTMNTSDQNVFTLDTAFQRRWNMRLIENDISKVNPRFANKEILDTGVTWKHFNTEINTIILEKNIHMTSLEDKRLGCYFIDPSDLIFDPKEYGGDKDERIRASHQNRRFPEKVLKYLWDDAFKLSRQDVFKTTKYMSLEDVVRKFRTSRGQERFSIFKENLYNALVQEKNNTKNGELNTPISNSDGIEDEKPTLMSENDDSK